MNKKHLIFLSGILLMALAARAEESVSLSAAKACRSGESWELGNTVRKDFQTEFKDFLAKHATPARGFSQALALRRWAPSVEAKRLAEYWMARSFFSANLIHLSKLSFEAVAQDEAEPGVRIAALDCLNAIHEKTPAISSTAIKPDDLSKLAALPVNHAQKEAIWRYSFNYFLSSFDKEALSVLRGSGPLEQFAQGVWNARTNKHAAAIQNLETLLEKNGMASSSNLVDIDVLNLMIGRSYYSVGNFEKAAIAFKRVQKTSNQLSESLSELSWSHLMAGEYREAIGIAQSLQVGGLKHTFAPEALMVMAMSMNELCQFPGSFEAIKLFKKNYESSFAWLQKWHDEKNATSLYSMAIEFIQKKSEVPDRIASEWIKSPLFLETQGEINLVSDEKEAIDSFPQIAAQEHKAMAVELLALGRNIKERLQDAKAVRAGRRLASLNELPRQLLRDIATFRTKVTHYRRFGLAALPWQKITAKNRTHVEGLKRSLVSHIDADLKKRTDNMLTQLLEIAENNQLVEVEIYSEASKDIIWQNAHPDYKEVAQKLKDERNDISRQNQLHWGSVDAGEDAEVWEDELGSMFANVFDNCSSKDRYLAVKRR